MPPRLIFAYERMLTPNIGVELVLGIPPQIKAKATGSVAFLGDDVLSAKNVAPTLLFNYHFGEPGDTWRPYVGVGHQLHPVRQHRVDAGAASRDERLVGAGRAGRHRLRADQGLGPVCQRRALEVKSDLVAVGATVLTTTIDFRPVTYSFGVAYKF